MDEMDYVMHNGPNSSTPRSHHQPTQSGCPYMRGEHSHATLPHPSSNLGLSPGRSHYDPVHPASNAWQPPMSFWSQTPPTHPPPLPQHQPRNPMTEQLFGPAAFGGFQPPAHSPIPPPQPVPGQNMSDPFASGPGSMGWAYRRGEDSFRPAGRSGEGIQRFGPISSRPNHQMAGFERGTNSPSAPRSLPALNLAQSQTPSQQSPQPPPLHMPNSADNSLPSGPRASFTPNESPTRGSRLPSTTTVPSNQTHPGSSALDLDVGARAPRRDMFASRQTEIPSIPLTPPIPPMADRRPMPPSRARSNVRPISDLSDPADSEEDVDGAMDDEHEAHIMRLEAQLSTQGSTPFPSRMSELPEERIRAHQLFRGAMANRRVASRSAIASLQSVEITSLPEDERMCMICYNDFGSPTPEGINEAPLRLPKCKHVFGDHCIKKWFEESDSCPYCRDKVPSESQMRASQHAVHQFIRAQRLANARGAPSAPGGPGSPGGLGTFLDVETSLRRAHGGVERLMRMPERRSPPDELDNRRRTRPRHGSGSLRPSPPSSISNGGNPRPASFAGASPSAPVHQPQHSPPVREHVSWQPSFQHHEATRRLTSVPRQFPAMPTPHPRFVPQYMGPPMPSQPPMMPPTHYQGTTFHSIPVPDMPAVSAPSFNPTTPFMRMPGQESSLANPLNNGAAAPVENGAPYPGPAAIPGYPLPPLDNHFANFGGPPMNGPTSTPPVSNGDNWQ